MGHRSGRCPGLQPGLPGRWPGLPLGRARAGAGANARARVDATLGYALALPGARGVLTPYGELTLYAQRQPSWLPTDLEHAIPTSCGPAAD